MALRADIITLFPEMFAALEASIPGRAMRAGGFSLKTHNLRQWAINKHGQVDDVPYGGEPGMVLRPEPIQAALQAIRAEIAPAQPRVILMSAQGRVFSQEMAENLAKEPNLLILCGHYKGVDQRIVDAFVDEEISIGDYVLSGGELPAMVLLDAVVRLLPGVLHDIGSAETDSFQRPGRLGWPVYTRPQSFAGADVPEVLVSGHHENIHRWRLSESLKLTQKRRPDLLSSHPPSDEEKRLGKGKPGRPEDLG
jgi:tRNA (guanine37-N1)-methyltransferase